MGYHGVNLLSLAIELDGLATIFLAAKSGFFFLFVWPLCGILLGLFIEYFALFCRVSGAMHQVCFFTGLPIAQMACMICLAISSAALLGVGWIGKLSSLTFPGMTGTVRFCPVGIFRSVTNFIELL